MGFLTGRVGGSRRPVWSWQSSCYITIHQRGYLPLKPSNTLILRKSNHHHNNPLGKFCVYVLCISLLWLTGFSTAWLRWRVNGTNWRQRGRRPGNARRKPQANLTPQISTFPIQHFTSSLNMYPILRMHARNLSYFAFDGLVSSFLMLFSFHTFITSFGSP